MWFAYISSGFAIASAALGLRRLWPLRSAAQALLAVSLAGAVAAAGLVWVADVLVPAEDVPAVFDGGELEEPEGAVDCADKAVYQSIGLVVFAVAVIGGGVAFVAARRRAGFGGAGRLAVTAVVLALIAWSVVLQQGGWVRCFES